MPAYIVASIEETDPVAFERYRAEALPVVARYSGRSLIQGTTHEKLEGNWAPRRLVIIEFPSEEAARRWYESPEYSGPKALRHACARTDMLLFKGREA
jgi:uncharacterized protein (DUF1330 family)